MADTISVVLGRNLRAVRDEFGLTLADVAKGVQGFGVKWSTGRLTQVEHGEGAATLDLLVILALTLSKLTKHEVSPLSLLETDGPVRIGGSHKRDGGVQPIELSAEAFGRIMAGEQFDVRLSDMSGEAQERIGADLLESFERSAADYGPGITGRQVQDAERAWTLADERAARKLGMGVKTFTGHCIRLWGHLLSVEVEGRSDPDDSPQKRGRITRGLMDELREAVRRGDD